MSIYLLAPTVRSNPQDVIATMVSWEDERGIFHNLLPKARDPHLKASISLARPIRGVCVDLAFPWSTIDSRNNRRHKVSFHRCHRYSIQQLTPFSQLSKFALGLSWKEAWISFGSFVYERRPSQNRPKLRNPSIFLQCLCNFAQFMQN